MSDDKEKKEQNAEQEEIERDAFGRKKKPPTYSKNGKRLGRPPKQKLERIMPDAEPGTIGEMVVQHPRRSAASVDGGGGLGRVFSDEKMSDQQIISLELEMRKEIWGLPRVDTNDAEKVQGRYLEYLDICKKYLHRPTIAGFAESLGVTRLALWQWINGVRPKDPAVVAVIEKVYSAINSTLEDLLMQNKIHPASGIFLLKQSGYKDTQEVVVRADKAEGKTEQQLEEEYLQSIPEVDD